VEVSSSAVAVVGGTNGRRVAGYVMGGVLLSRAKGTNLIAAINSVLLYLRRWRWRSMLLLSSYRFSNTTTKCPQPVYKNLVGKTYKIAFFKLPTTATLPYSFMWKPQND